MERIDKVDHPESAGADTVRTRPSGEAHETPLRKLENLMRALNKGGRGATFEDMKEGVLHWAFATMALSTIWTELHDRGEDVQWDGYPLSESLSDVAQRIASNGISLSRKADTGHQAKQEDTRQVAGWLYSLAKAYDGHKPDSELTDRQLLAAALMVEDLGLDERPENIMALKNRVPSGSHMHLAEALACVRVGQDAAKRYWESAPHADPVATLRIMAMALDRAELAIAMGTR